MEIQKEQIAPELFQAIVAKAAANGLTVNDYLAQLIGYTNGAHPAENESLAEFMADMEALATLAAVYDDLHPRRHLFRSRLMTEFLTSSTQTFSFASRSETTRPTTSP
jgi:hypothetical protein